MFLSMGVKLALFYITWWSWWTAEWDKQAPRQNPKPKRLSKLLIGFRLVTNLQTDCFPATWPIKVHESFYDSLIFCCLSRFRWVEAGWWKTTSTLSQNWSNQVRCAALPNRRRRKWKFQRDVEALLIKMNSMNHRVPADNLTTLSSRFFNWLIVSTNTICVLNPNLRILRTINFNEARLQAQQRTFIASFGSIKRARKFLSRNVSLVQSHDAFKVKQLIISWDSTIIKWIITRFFSDVLSASESSSLNRFFPALHRLCCQSDKIIHIWQFYKVEIQFIFPRRRIH